MICRVEYFPKSNDSSTTIYSCWPGEGHPCRCRQKPETPETLGPYTLIRQIGQGGNSVVHQAVDRRTGKAVALKAHVIPPSLSSGERAGLLVRFGREAQAMARLSHPNIVAIHEVGEQDGTHFLAMEYLEGQTLRERLTRGPLTPTQAAPILAQIAGAVDAVHAAGIVHRDIKPGNIMLLPDGRAKLLDFGIARQSEDTTVTAAHSIVGSPAYMAPEQVNGDLGDPASDIWALGVLLYEMLAGRPPFQGANIPSVLFQVTHATPPPVLHVGGTVQRVLRRALEKAPVRRYPTARALADALQDAVGASLNTPWPELTRRWGPWAAVCVVGAALGTLLVMQHTRTPEASRSESALPSLPPAPSASTLPTPSSFKGHSHRVRHHKTHHHHAAPSLLVTRRGPQSQKIQRKPVEHEAPPIHSHDQSKDGAKTELRVAGTCLPTARLPGVTQKTRCHCGGSRAGGN